MSTKNLDTKKRLRNLFYGKTKESIVFNRFLLAVNVIAIFLFLLEPIFPKEIMVRIIEIFFGVIFLIEYIVRLWIAVRKTGFIFGLINLLDLIVITSLFAPYFMGDLAFLRVIRSLRILRTYRLLVTLKVKRNWFVRNEEVLYSALNLFIFVFVMTDIVYVMQVESNESINTYIDALYFTLTTLTTTGFGDITLHGTTGKALAIFIMVFGITLFVKLARDIIRPQKVIYQCPDCGLNHHEYDAVHCKHCGRQIKIETDGQGI
ncbi:MAG: ion transporter [Nitrospinota bacterium]